MILYKNLSDEEKKAYSLKQNSNYIKKRNKTVTQKQYKNQFYYNKRLTTEQKVGKYLRKKQKELYYEIVKKINRGEINEE